MLIMTTHMRHNKNILGMDTANIFNVYSIHECKSNNKEIIKSPVTRSNGFFIKSTKIKNISITFNQVHIFSYSHDEIEMFGKIYNKFCSKYDILLNINKFNKIPQEVIKYISTDFSDQKYDEYLYWIPFEPLDEPFSKELNYTFRLYRIDNVEICVDNYKSQNYKVIVLGKESI